MERFSKSGNSNKNWKLDVIDSGNDLQTKKRAKQIVVIHITLTIRFWQQVWDANKRVAGF